MEINGNPLPQKLISLIESGSWDLPKEKDYLDAIYKGFRYLELYGIGTMQLETYGLIKYSDEYPEMYKDFLGKPDEQYPPGDIDILKAIVIADLDLGSDAPIALDYREDKNNPSVVILHYSKVGTRWLKIADTFDEFWEAISINRSVEGKN